MKNDDYLQSQIMPMLQPGEQVLHTAYMVRQPGLLVQMFLIGGLLLFLITKAYFVVLTNRRMILIRTKMKFFSGGPQQLNLGVEQWDVRNLANCTVSGFAYNRSMTWTMHSGGSETLRIAPIERNITGTKRFFHEVPQLVVSGQLQQLAAGAPPMQQLPPMQQPPMQQMQPPMQHQQMQQMQQMQQPQGFAPGARVLITVQGGARHPGTIVQAGQGQYLCAMPDGQSYWFPAGSVGPG